MSRYDDILRDLPAGLNEADLIDMVDGAVPHEREAAVIQALRAQPRLGLLVKQLRADRAAVVLAEGGAESAPANMLEAIQLRLDREALSELMHEAEEASAPIPISRVQPGLGSRGGPGVLGRLAESVWARRLATAASIAIVGGLGLLGARELVRKWPSLPGTVPIATGGGGASERGGGAGTPDKIDVADRGTGAGADGATDGADPSTMVAGAADPNKTDAVAEPAAKPLTAAEAVALAQEGRLVISVRSRQLAGTIKHLETLSRAAGSGGAGETRWRSADPANPPTELAMLATPLPDPSMDTRPPMNPTFVGPSLPVFASSDGKPRPPAMDAAASGSDAQAPAQRRVRAIRVVRMNADAGELGDLLRDLNITREQEAEFRVLPGSLEQPPPLDARSVLWWASGPESWTRKIVVPIVVETVE